MTALTALSLPYPIGTDRPCDAAATWAAFAVKLDSLLGPMQDICNRISPAVPACRVRRTTSQSTGSGTPAFVSFDTVSMDTDSMANLSRSSSDVRPNRFGRFLVHASCVGTTSVINNLNVRMELVKGAAGQSNPFGAGGFGGGGPADSVSILDGALPPHYWRETRVFDWGASDLVVAGSAAIGFGVLLRPVSGQVFTITSCEMSVWWYDDVVSGI